MTWRIHSICIQCQNDIVARVLEELKDHTSEEEWSNETSSTEEDQESKKCGQNQEWSKEVGQMSHLAKSQSQQQPETYKRTPLMDSVRSTVRTPRSSQDLQNGHQCIINTE